MTKELLAIEFRYYDAPIGKDHISGYTTRKITIGIYDTLEEAIVEGNNCVKTLSKYFEVKSDDQFKLRHLFGFPNRLVTNTCYNKGIEFFAKIESLKFDDLVTTIDETFKALERYKKYESKRQSDYDYD